MKIIKIVILILIISIKGFSQKNRLVIKQPLNAKNENIIDSSKSIKVGQKVPDVLINNIKGLELDGKKYQSAHVSDFRGKLLIIDFWATWCNPCRGMIPKMDSLQKKLGDKVVFLPVSYEKSSIVEPVIAQMKKIYNFKLPEVTEDKILSKLFPHTTLPHYVWIDTAGIVRAITEYKDVTGDNIRKILTGTNVDLEVKKDFKIPYDYNRPLFFDNNGGNGQTLLYHVFFAGYVPGLKGGSSTSNFDPVKGQKFTCANCSMLWLYRLAFKNDNFPNSQIRILSKDSLKITTKLKGNDYKRWETEGNAWCYELQVPPSLGTTALSIIQADLRRLFPAWAAGIETQTVKCLALVRTSSEDKLKSTGGASQVNIGPYECHLKNGNLKSLIVRLKTQFMQLSPLPIIDATGYIGKVDLDFEAPLNSVSALNKALEAYDLKLVEKDAPVKLLVIRDVNR